jgi:hypothetical protein
MEDRPLGSATKWAFQIFSNSVRFSGIGLARRRRSVYGRGQSRISQPKFCTGRRLEQVTGREERAPHLGRPKANNTIRESRIHLTDYKASRPTPSPAVPNEVEVRRPRQDWATVLVNAVRRRCLWGIYRVRSRFYGNSLPPAFSSRQQMSSITGGLCVHARERTEARPSRQISVLSLQSVQEVPEDDGGGHSGNWI